MKRCCKALIGWLAVLMLFSCAAAEPQVTLNAEEWSAEAGQVSTFSGVIVPGETNLAGATLALSVSTGQEESGTLVFTSLNGKKIKIRNQKETCDLPEDFSGDEITFEGSWFLPEEGSFPNVTLTLTVLDPNGETLGTGTLVTGEQQEEDGASQPDKMLRLPFDPQQVMLILAVLCGCVWAAAVARMILLRKRTGKA